jgi:flagellar basal body-associated protein FliL
MVDKKLIDYINSQIKAGYPPDKIRDVLISQGWSEKDVNEALAGFEKKSEKTEKPVVKAEKPAEKPSGGGVSPGGKDVSLKLIGIIVIVILVIAAVVAYMIMSGLGPPPGPQCGDGTCDEGEDYTTCPSDCQAPVVSERKVLVSPATQTVAVDEYVTVNVIIYNATDIYGFQFNLNYDSDVLEFNNATEGAFLNENGGADTLYLPPSNPSPGLIKNVVCVRKGQIGGVDGDGTLVTITFTALSAGTSPITLSGVQLSNSQVQAVQFTTSDGEIVIQ